MGKKISFESGQQNASDEAKEESKIDSSASGADCKRHSLIGKASPRFLVAYARKKEIQILTGRVVGLADVGGSHNHKDPGK